MERHAVGALLGALVGDAAGATLEFVRVQIGFEHATKAMQMPGGGVLRVGPGQITDDGELSLCLLRGLLDQDPNSEPNLNQIATQYVDWYESEPFDIGNTCRTSFSAGSSYRVSNGIQGLANHMKITSESSNYESQANGGLMRIVPMVLWSVGHSPEVIGRNCARDAVLSHPNQVCQECNAVYGIALAHLVRHPGDASGALQVASDYVNSNTGSAVREWLHESQDVGNLTCTRCIGHVKYGFILALYHLRKQSSFEDAIQHTLMKGGDTDTNAAIVGGMMGALHGEDGIPDYMKLPVVKFDCTKKASKFGHVRALRFSAGSGVAQLREIWKTWQAKQYLDIVNTSGVLGN